MIIHLHIILSLTLVLIRKRHCCNVDVMFASCHHHSLESNALFFFFDLVDCQRTGWESAACTVYTRSFQWKVASIGVLTVVINSTVCALMLGIQGWTSYSYQWEMTIYVHLVQGVSEQMLYPTWDRKALRVLDHVVALMPVRSVIQHIIFCR